MTIAQELFNRVPVGEENAVTGRLIWEEVGMWSLTTIKHRLKILALEGCIQRKRMTRGKHETNLYFRLPDAVYTPSPL